MYVYQYLIQIKIEPVFGIFVIGVLFLVFGVLCLVSCRVGHRADFQPAAAVGCPTKNLIC